MSTGVQGVDAEAMLRALGPGAQWLDPAVPGRRGAVAMDCDCCWCDEVAVAEPGQWLALLEAGRLADVRGAFSLAWARNDGSLLLARDAVGERTLYYARVDGGVLFASTLRGLLASGKVARRLDPMALALYLSCAYVPGADTLVEGVRELLPGQMLEVRSGKVTVSSWWRLPGRADDSAHEDELRRQLRSTLDRAVERRLPRGEPVAATLSGGIDSSLVVALAARLHDRPVHTFSVSFGEGYLNELPFSDIVARHCSTRHCVLELPPETVLHHLDQTIALLSEPNGDPLTVPNALLFRQARAASSVVLNGEGGDPCFGGPKNTPMVLAELLGHADPDHDGLARMRSYLRSHQKCYDDLADMLCPEVAATLRDASLERVVQGWFDQARQESFVNKLMALNVALKGAHHILTKVDAVSFPFGVVPRSPLFDRDVVEMAMNLPARLKLRGSVEKYLLKEAVRDLLPAGIVDRPKSGMLVPVEGWFQGPLLKEARERLLEGLAPRGLVRRSFIETLLAGRLGGVRPRRGVKIWLLVTLESWLRGVLDP